MSESSGENLSMRKAAATDSGARRRATEDDLLKKKMAALPIGDAVLLGQGPMDNARIEQALEADDQLNATNALRVFIFL